MKKILFGLLMVIIFFSSSILFAEEKGVLSLNPLGLVFGIFNAEYDRKLDSGTSIAGRGLYWGLAVGDWKWSAFGAGVSYRIYSKKEAMKGLAYGPAVDILLMSAEYKTTELDLTTWTWKEKTEKGNSTFITLSGEVIYRWVFKSQITIDLGTGLGYTIGTLELAGEKIPFGGFGWSGLRANVGYAF